MSPAWIRPRAVKKSSRNPRGRTFQVLYRRGGRDYPVESAGTFKTERDAKLRRDLVGGWLATGLDPKAELATLARTTVQHKNANVWLDEWLSSLHQLDEKSKRTYRYGVEAVLGALGDDINLHTVSVADCERAVGLLIDPKDDTKKAYAAKTVWTYWPAWAQLLDYVGREPNPARSRKVKLPRQRRTPVNPPTSDHMAAMLGRIAHKYVEPMVLIEQTAVRVETIETLEWSNVDLAGNRFRTTEKGDKTRWVDIPAWYSRLLAGRAAPEDRVGRVFPGITAGGLRGAMRTVCQNAGIPHYHPHDLRHRRASLWHLQGVPDAVLAERVGHERASFTKDVYVHVMPVGEIPAERLEAMVIGAAE